MLIDCPTKPERPFFRGKQGLVQTNACYLTVFAHRGEAQAFFERQRFWRPQPSLKYFYQCEEGYLLICGQGQAASAHRLQIVLSFLTAQQLRLQVINYGIAGALDDTFALGQLCAVAHVCQRFPETAILALDVLEGVTCVSTVTAVNDRVQRQTLAHMACLVDQELYTLAHGCRHYNVSIRSFKCISDRADENVDCQAIRRQAAIASVCFYDHFRELKAGEQTLV